MLPIFGEIIGWEALLVLAIIALLFGSSQLPKLARSLGEASRELKKGLSDEPRPSTKDQDPPPAPTPSTKDQDPPATPVD